MARRKFPSDGRPWFRCLTDLLYDERLNGDCPADVAWFYIRLLAMLQQTGSRDGVISLDRRALNLCACREQHRHALHTARTGAARKLYTLSVDGAYTLITVPNWPIIQGFTPKQTVPREEEIRGEESREEGQERTSSPPRALEDIPTDHDLISQSDITTAPLATREDAEKLAQLLAKKPGTREQQVEWVYQNVDQIVADCEIDAAEKNRDPTWAELRSKVYRYYHQHCRNLKREKDGHQTWGEKDSQSIKRELGIADG